MGRLIVCRPVLPSLVASFCLLAILVVTHSASIGHAGQDGSIVRHRLARTTRHSEHGELHPGSSVAAQSTPATSARTYELIDTWENVPWTLRAGFVYSPVDVTSTPDGRLFVLDLRRDGAYLHIFGADLAPMQVARLSGAAHQERLDASADGTVYTVGRSASSGGVPAGRTRFLVEEYGPAGRLISQFNVDLPESCGVTDIAVAAGGWIYLSRHDRELDLDTNATAIDVYRRDGTLADVIDSTDYYVVDHGLDGHMHMLFTRVDVAPDGELYALPRFHRCT